MRALLLLTLLAFFGAATEAFSQGAGGVCHQNEYRSRVEGNQHFCACKFGWERPNGDVNKPCAPIAGLKKTCLSAGQFFIDRLEKLKTSALPDQTVSADLPNNAKLACEGLQNVFKSEGLGSCEATCGQIFCFAPGGIMATYNRYRKDPKGFKFVFMTLVPPVCK